MSDFMSRSELLEENGEYVDAQALTPARTWVRYGGPDAVPVTTDGPLPEISDLVAGWYMIAVESYERAVELAAYVSSEPGRCARSQRAASAQSRKRSENCGVAALTSTTTSAGTFALWAAARIASGDGAS
jgi:hypothetical protein